MSHPYIVPAIIPTSRQSVINYSELLAFAPELHVDVVDGNFVETVSWPYLPQDVPTAVASYLHQFSLEIDLMVAQPLPAAAAWIQAGADRLIFHIETISVTELASFDNHASCSIGISASNDVPLDTLAVYAPYADYIQVMGIAQIGSQGQPLDERVFAKIADIKHCLPKLPISIDGSVNQSTIRRLAQAEVERLVVGSAIVQTSNPERAYCDLKRLLA